MTSGSAIRQRDARTLQPSICGRLDDAARQPSKNGSSTQMTIGSVMTACVRISAR